MAPDHLAILHAMYAAELAGLDLQQALAAAVGERDLTGSLRRLDRRLPVVLDRMIDPADLVR